MTVNDLEKECSAGGVCIFVYVVCVRNVYFKNGVQEWSQDFSARNAKVCAAYWTQDFSARNAKVCAAYWTQDFSARSAKVCAAYAYGLVECAFFIFMVLLYHL